MAALRPLSPTIPREGVKVKTESPLLELEQVTKQYDTIPEPTVVLQGVDLRVAPGETVAIVGPSGCGKSTLLNLIATLDQPSSGRVLFENTDVHRLTAADMSRFRNREIGLVFQHHHLLPQCTALENVLIPTIVHRRRSDAQDRAANLLERVGLADRMDRRPAQLSGGERQRVAVVRALVNEPSLLLADEPTGSLNEAGAEQLADLLVELNQDQAMALILVTHSRPIAGRMGRVCQLRDGVLSDQT